MNFETGFLVLGAILAIYIAARLVTAAYFKSKENYERTLKNDNARKTIQPGR